LKIENISIKIIATAKGTHPIISSRIICLEEKIAFKTIKRMKAAGLMKDVNLFFEEALKIDFFA
jgi:hypothetical protein